MVLLPIIWGTTFAVVQSSFVFASPILYTTIRFAFASLLFLVVGKQTRRGLVWLTSHKDETQEKRWLIIVGVSLALGYMFQVIGLLYTTTAKSAFLTSTAVVWTPLFGFLLHRERPKNRLILSIAISLAGIYLLSGVDLRQGLVLGDMLALLCAFSFAFYIVYLDKLLAPMASRFGNERNAAEMLIGVQLVIATAVLLLFLPFESMHISPNLTLLSSILYTALFATALTGFLQARYQPLLSPTIAVIFFMLEPVVALAIGLAVLDEHILPLEIAGAILIVVGVVIAQLGTGSEATATQERP